MYTLPQEISGDYLRKKVVHSPTHRTIDSFLTFLDSHIQVLAECGVDHLYIGEEFLQAHMWTQFSRKNSSVGEWGKFIDYFVSREVDVEYVRDDVLILWEAIKD
jgi:hypothetical protein